MHEVWLQKGQVWMSRIEFVWAGAACVRDTYQLREKDSFKTMKDDSRNLVELVELFLKILERTGM